MEINTSTHAIAFQGVHSIASGALSEVALAVKAQIDRGEPETILVFDFTTSRPIELDLRGDADEILARIPAAPETEIQEEEPSPPVKRGPGRPKLGVVSREVTLLPRHWKWLSGQPGGASVTLRKLVEKARRASVEKDRLRLAQESAYRFLSTMGGNLPGFEEATRALFASDAERFAHWTQDWPADVREHARHLADACFGSPSAPSTASHS